MAASLLLGDSQGSTFFDGVNDFISFDAVITTSAFSINLLVSVNSLSDTNAIFNQASSSNIANSLIVGLESGKIKFSIGGSKILSNDNIVLNTVYHVVVTRSAAGSAKMYINGSLQSSTFQNNANILNTTTILGKYNTQFFSGVLDEVAVFDSALTSGEIGTLYDTVSVMFARTGSLTSNLNLNVNNPSLFVAKTGSILSNITVNVINPVYAAFSGSTGNIHADLNASVSNTFSASTGNLTGNIVGTSRDRLFSAFFSNTGNLSSSITGGIFLNGSFSATTGSIASNLFGVGSNYRFTGTTSITVSSNNIADHIVPRTLVELSKHSDSVSAVHNLIINISENITQADAVYRLIEELLNENISISSILDDLANLNLTIKDRVKNKSSAKAYNNINAILTETIVHSNLLYRSFIELLADSTSISETLSVKNNISRTLNENIFLVEQYTSALTINVLISNLITIIAKVLTILPVSIQETITSSDILNVYSILAPTVIETVTASDNNSVQYITVMSISEDINIANSLSAHSFYDIVVNESIFTLGAMEIDSGWYTFVVNTKNLGLSEYKDYAFESMSEGYAANASGIYKLNDAASAEVVEATIQTGFLDLGTSKHKHVPYAYLGLSNSSEAILKVITKQNGVQNERHYKLSQSTDSIDTRRVRLGKGVKSDLWKFELVSEGSIDLDQFELLPLTLNRRI